MAKTNNELIAEFLGWKLCDDPDCAGDPPHYMFGECSYDMVYVTSLKFHKSWDALMPVVEKILSSTYTANYNLELQIKPFFKTIKQSGSVFLVSIDRFSIHQGNTLIEATYNAVVEFIKLTHDTQTKS